MCLRYPDSGQRIQRWTCMIVSVQSDGFAERGGLTGSLVFRAPDFSLQSARLQSSVRQTSVFSPLTGSSHEARRLRRRLQSFHPTMAYLITRIPKYATVTSSYIAKLFNACYVYSHDAEHTEKVSKSRIRPPAEPFLASFHCQYLSPMNISGPC